MPLENTGSRMQRNRATDARDYDCAYKLTMLDIKIVIASPADSEIVGELVHSLLMEFFAEQSHLFPIEKMKQAAAELLTPGSGVWSFLATTMT